MGEIVEGDDTTIKCETYNGHSIITWHPPSGLSLAIEAGSAQYPAGTVAYYITNINTYSDYFQGISRVTQTPNRDTRNIQDLCITEVRWRNISKSATGVYECRYRDNVRHNVAVRLYSMDVRDAIAPRLAKQLGRNKKHVYVETQNRENVQLECHLIDGAPTPTISWLKVTYISIYRFKIVFIPFCYRKDGVIFDKDRLIKDLKINETSVNGTLYSYLHLMDVDDASEGEYTCLFENRLGSDNQTFRLEVAMDDSFFGATISIIIVLIVITALLILMAKIFFVRLSVRRKHKQNNAITLNFEYVEMIRRLEIPTILPKCWNLY